MIINKNKINIRGKEWPCHTIGTGIPCLIIGVSPLYLFIQNSALTKKIQFIFAPLYCENIHSDFDVSNLTKEDWINDLDEVRKQLNLDKIALFAHTGNGFTALEYALKFSEQVLFNILISVMPCWTDEFASARSNFFQNEFFQKNASTERKIALENNLKSFAEQKTKLALDEIYVAQSIAMTPLLWFDYNYDTSILWKKMHTNGIFYNHFFNKIYKNYDNREGYKKLKVPTFMALGKYDFIFQPEDWDFVSANKNIYKQIFAKSVHYPMPEEQKLFDQAVLDWLDKI